MSKEAGMPWLSDDVPDWDELTDDERDAYRVMLRELGLEPASEDDDGYYE
jgi:hypothetical protein